MKIKINAIPYIMAVILLMIAAWYDYPITDALYMRYPLFGRIWERYALTLVYMMLPLTAMLYYRLKENRWYLFLAWAALFYIVCDLAHYTYDLLPVGILCNIMVLAIMLTALLWMIVRMISVSWVQMHIHFFRFFTCVLISAVITNTLCKCLWGRIRYRQMLNVNEFCVWFVPNGINGYVSFPSGHTCAWSSVLCFLKYQPKHAACLRYVIIISSICLMAFSRMVMGAHFLSDTVVGFLITYSWYLFYCRYFEKRNVL